MMTKVFDHTDYRKYLNAVLKERGRKKHFAEFISCQTTFLSSVLAGHINLSLEHAMRATEFLELNDREAHFFMLAVHHEKAGTRQLKDYYWRQIDSVRQEQNKISNRVSTHETISAQHQLIFYNSWLYVAIHVLCAISEFQSRKALAHHFRLPIAHLNSVIDFLCEQGIVREEGDKLKQGPSRVHLAKGSPFLIKHHTNWRMKSIQAMDFERENDLHYTMVMSLSKRTFLECRNFF